MRTLASALVASGVLLGAAATATPASAKAVPPTWAATAQPSATPAVDVIQVSGLIDPVIVDFVTHALDDAARSASLALVIQLNSPGATVSRRRLDALVAALCASRVPVAVWVGVGARARGGAARLVEAAGIAGAAPKASLGPAPRSAERPACAPRPPLRTDRPLGQRAALASGAADVGAATLGDFIVNLDGREVRGRTLMLPTTIVDRGHGLRQRRPQVAVRFAKPSLLARLLHTVASPSAAYLLLVVGLLLVVFEYFTAGIGVAGIVGAGALVMAAYGLATLPTRSLGAALVVGGVAALAVDIQSGVPRFWTTVGLAALVAGSLELYRGQHVGIYTVILVGLGVAVVAIAGMPAMIRSRFSTPTIGRESMIGELGRATVDVAPEGVVRVREALWRARTNRATPIHAGDPVRVVALDGLLLEVEPESGGARDAHH
ncbi:MAG: NfeD family protein [Acidimicrobiales bacterium]